MSSPSDPGSLTRRRLLLGAGALATGSVAAVGAQRAGLLQPRAQVAAFSVASYGADLVDLLTRGLREFPDTAARIPGARVVLKPNFVEFSPLRPVNTNPLLVAAAVEAFRGLGAREVTVAEGPGHCRDTELIGEQSGLSEQLALVGAPFVDLNADVFRQVRLARNFTGRGTLPIAGTILGADLVVSMPKLKTHHWAGVTLSMKNLFGTVPGQAFGCPKNPLHWAGINQSIVDLWLAIKPGFAIVDGIVGMEGDGPIRGDAVNMGVIVMGDQCPAVDATAARLMGVDPEQLAYLEAAGRLGGTIAAHRIEHIGDEVAPRTFVLGARFGGPTAG